jgi:glycerol-3-phosphate O-acyltransferase
MQDEISEAVLAHEDVLKYLRGGYGESGAQAREKINGYLDELRTTQRHKFYRALQHPLYPILRKIERKHENLHYVTAAVARHRIVYASNHKSHCDYLVEPLVLDDNGIRPPLIVAGINLFGGPLGLIHKHVTGAIPIRRAMKDPAYLITLKAYVAELVKKHDIFFYPEGGRSYSGELKPYKTGLLHAALQANVKDLLIVPASVSYDLVLEDHALASQRVKRRQRPFTREIAEMVGLAMGYRSRSFTVFGHPIPAGAYDPESRKDVLDLAHLLREATGKLVKVLPTAIVASAMHPSITPHELESRLGARLDHLLEAGANLAVRDVKGVMEDGVARLELRGVIQSEHGKIRVRDRNVLRYYARSIQHLLPDPG